MNKLLTFGLLLSLSACVPPVVQPIVDAGPNPCEGQTCGGQGTCAVVNGAAAVCVCNAGFFADGLACKPVMAGAECGGVTCDGRGMCVVLAGTPNTPKCECDARSVSAGPTTCIARPAPCEGIMCGGQGACAVTGTTAVCLCNAGFRANGTSCEAIVSGQECTGVTCSGHGTCAVLTGPPATPLCRCEAGYVEAAGTTCVAVTDPCSGITCSGRGTCAVANGAPLCSCEAGFDRVGTQCLLRSSADAGAGVCAGVTCSSRGVCAVVGGTTATCICNSGYVASGTDCVLTGSSGGSLTVLAGVIGAGGSADGPPGMGRLLLPVAVSSDSMGNVFVAEQAGVIRKVTAAGVVSTLAGLTGIGSENRGYVNGSGSSARFARLGRQSIVADPNGTVFVMDSDNCAIRQVTPAGVVTTFAGALPDARGLPSCAADDIAPIDGTGSAARFVSSGGYYTLGLTRDAAGNLYTLQNRRIAGDAFYVRKISPAGAVTTTQITGIPVGGLNQPNMAALRAAVSADGLTVHLGSNLWLARVALPTGAWTNVSAAPFLRSYSSLCATATGSVYAAAESLISMSGMNRESAWVVRLNGSSVVDVASTEAGADGYVDAIGPAARFRQGLSMWCDDTNGRLLVADTQNNVIRAINTTTNAVTTVGGIGASTGAALDGTGAVARFGSPSRVVADRAGTWYVADTGGHAVRKISATGAVTTLAGQLGTLGSLDGTGAAARLDGPVGLAIDSTDTLYVGDRGRLRKVTAAGVVTTLATSATGLGTTRTVVAMAVDSTSQTLFYGSGDNGNFFSGSVLMRVSTTGGSPVQVAPSMSAGIEMMAVDSTRRRLYLGLSSGALQCRDLLDPAAIPLPSCVGVSLPGFGNLLMSGLGGQMALGPSGTIYVTNRDSTVVKVLTVAPYASTIVAGAPGAYGVELGALPARLFNPTGVAVNPVTGQLGIVSAFDGALLVTTGFSP